jgi:hypothetical protein
MALILNRNNAVLVCDFLDIVDLLRVHTVSKVFYEAATLPFIWFKFVKKIFRVFLWDKILTIDWKLATKETMSLDRRLNVVKPFEKQLIARTCDVSSTDHPSQSILETLNDSESDFWSSTGSGSTDVNEFVAYELKEPICLVKEIHLSFFAAYYQRNTPLYISQQVRFKFGFKFEACKESEWVYVSPAYSVAETKEPQVFKLPKWIPCHFVRIEMIGKVQTQSVDALYYTCLQRVRAVGFPFTFIDPVLHLVAIDSVLQNAVFIDYLKSFTTESICTDEAITTAAPLDCYPACAKSTIFCGKPHRLFIPMERICPGIVSSVQQHNLQTPFNIIRLEISDRLCCIKDIQSAFLSTAPVSDAEQEYE